MTGHLEKNKLYYYWKFGIDILEMKRSLSTREHLVSTHYSFSPWSIDRPSLFLSDFGESRRHHHHASRRLEWKKKEVGAGGETPPYHSVTPLINLVE